MVKKLYYAYFAYDNKSRCRYGQYIIREHDITGETANFYEIKACDGSPDYVRKSHIDLEDSHYFSTLQRVELNELFLLRKAVDSTFRDYNLIKERLAEVQKKF